MGVSGRCLLFLISSSPHSPGSRRRRGAWRIRLRAAAEAEVRHTTFSITKAVSQQWVDIAWPSPVFMLSAHAQANFKQSDFCDWQRVLCPPYLNSCWPVLFLPFPHVSGKARASYLKPAGTTALQRCSAFANALQ